MLATVEVDIVVKEIDARGLECPKPVVLTKKALEEGATELRVLVDTEIARDNVSRLAKKMGCTIETIVSDRQFVVTLQRAEETEKEMAKSVQGPSIIFINSNTIGKGSDELGEALLKTFINTLAESDDKPDRLVFMNSGVKLVAEDSDVLEGLKDLEGEGVEVVACGTCLEYFSLKDRIAVGKISNMYDILDSMLAAGKVITV